MISVSEPPVVACRVRAQLAPQIQNALTPLTDGNHPDALVLGVTVRQDLKVSAYARLSALISTLNPSQMQTSRIKDGGAGGKFQVFELSGGTGTGFQERSQRGKCVPRAAAQERRRCRSERKTRQNPKTQLEFQSCWSSVDDTVIF